MSPESFEYLLSLVGPLITEQSTKLREAVPVGERLPFTLPYLASGDNQQSISFSNLLGRTTVGNIVYETCLAIWEAFMGSTSKLQIQVLNGRLYLLVAICDARYCYIQYRSLHFSTV